MHAGLVFALSAAAVSGLSVFVNKMGVAGTNPFMFTLLKNVVVSCLLLAGILLMRDFASLRRLNAAEWKRLAFIGLVGGSIPFLMFFWGLSMTTAVKAAALQKTMFVPASLMAFLFLKERLNKRAVIASSIVLGGILLASFSSFSEFNAGDGLVLGAAFLWSAEAVMSRKALSSMKASHVAFGRMFFGAAFMLPFIALAGNMSMPAEQGSYAWILATSALLLAYVALWYNALKKTAVSVAATALVASVPITAALSLLAGAALPPHELLGSALVAVGILMLASSTFRLGKAIRLSVISNERNAARADVRPDSK